MTLLRRPPRSYSRQAVPRALVGTRIPLGLPVSASPSSPVLCWRRRRRHRWPSEVPHESDWPRLRQSYPILAKTCVSVTLDYGDNRSNSRVLIGPKPSAAG
ncbi:unnamed protein product [Ectocarpus sp. CCAP 1310/34]|nr:unnamed protein product [Ectocarpus sp. CCAP 1310/34]